MRKDPKMKENEEEMESWRSGSDHQAMVKAKRSTRLTKSSSVQVVGSRSSEEGKSVAGEAARYESPDESCYSESTSVAGRQKKRRRRKADVENNSTGKASSVLSTSELVASSASLASM